MILLGSVVNEVQFLNINEPFVKLANVILLGIFVILLPPNISTPLVKLANVILLGSVVNEVQYSNINSPFVKLANVILLGNVVSEVQALNI